VLRGGALTRGRKSKRLSARWGDVRAEHVAVCSSGTAALHLACLAAGIEPTRGDCAGVTFWPRLAVSLCGGKWILPTLIQTPPDVAGIGAQRVREETRAVLPVDYAAPWRHRALADAIDREKIAIIEDACQRWARHRRRPRARASPRRRDVQFPPREGVARARGRCGTNNDDIVAESVSCVPMELSAIRRTSLARARAVGLRDA